MKKFYILVFIVSSILVGILTFASFIAGMAFRGDIHDSFFVKLFAPLFYIFRFPTHTLFNFGRGGGGSARNVASSQRQIATTKRRKGRLPAVRRY